MILATEKNIVLQNFLSVYFQDHQFRRARMVLSPGIRDDGRFGDRELSQTDENEIEAKQ